MWQVIDTENDNHVVSEHDTQRKAFNATRKIEPEPSIKRYFNPERRYQGSYMDWRYLTRKQRS